MPGAGDAGYVGSPDYPYRLRDSLTRWSLRPFFAPVAIEILDRGVEDRAHLMARRAQAALAQPPRLRHRLGALATGAGAKVELLKDAGDASVGAMLMLIAGSKRAVAVRTLETKEDGAFRFNRLEPGNHWSVRVSHAAFQEQQVGPIDAPEEGGVQEVVQKLGITKLMVSISHCRSHATAYAIALGPDDAM